MPDLTDNLSLSHIKLKDAYGLDRFESDLYDVTILCGANQQGKSSILDYVRDYFEGGTTPEAVRREDLDGDGVREAPCEKAEGWLTLSDGSTFYRWSTLKESHTDVFSADGAKLRAPKTYIDSLCSPGSFNPMEFLKYDPKQRAKFLLETLPLNFTAEQINKAFDAPVGKLSFMPLPRITGDVPLQRFNELYEGKLEERRELNHQHRNLNGMIEEFQAAMLPADEKDWGAERDRIQEEIDKIRKMAEALRSDLRDEVTVQISACLNHERETISALKDILSGLQALSDAGVPSKDAGKALMEESDNVSGKVCLFVTAVIDRADLNSELAKDLARIDKEESEALADASHRFGEAKAKADEQQREAGKKETVERTRKELEGVVTKIARIEAILKAMEKLKIEKLKDLPIENLDIVTRDKGGPTILVGGLPFDRLSGQQQLYFAIKCVNQAMTGRLRVIFAECAELDDEHLITLCEVCRTVKIGLIATMRRAGEKLRVLSLDQFKEIVANERRAISSVSV